MNNILYEYYITVMLIFSSGICQITNMNCGRTSIYTLLCIFISSRTFEFFRISRENSLVKKSF